VSGLRTRLREAVHQLSGGEVGLLLDLKRGERVDVVAATPSSRPVLPERLAESTGHARHAHDVAGHGPDVPPRTLGRPGPLLGSQRLQLQQPLVLGAGQAGGDVVVEP
jgi:hypothetical protein